MPTILESLLFEIGIDTKKLSGESKEAETSIFYPLDNLVDILIEANDNTETIIAAVTESARAKAMEFVKLIEKEVGPISFNVALRGNSLGFRGGDILGVKVGGKERQTTIV